MLRKIRERQRTVTELTKETNPAVPLLKSAISKLPDLERLLCSAYQSKVMGIFLWAYMLKTCLSLVVHKLCCFFLVYFWGLHSSSALLLFLYFTVFSRFIHYLGESVAEGSGTD